MTTFLEILTEIKDLLMANIGVFDNGYAYCRTDSGKGLAVTAGNNGEYVGINDVSGDYFYIRFDGKVGNVLAKAMNDCAVALAQTAPCSIVAVVNDADEFKLIDALVNELLKTKVITVKSAWYDPTAIVADEFKGLEKDVIEGIKSKIGERTIVRVDFEITRNFQTHSCEYSICKTC